MIYAPFHPDFAARITLAILDPASHREPSQGAAHNELSPYKTRWFHAERPDYRREGPWNTKVIIHDGRHRLLALSFLDHGNSDVSVSWVNEKLLFVRVWWGRIVATDLVVDVESRKFLYRVMSDFGEFLVSANRPPAPDR